MIRLVNDLCRSPSLNIGSTSFMPRVCKSAAFRVKPLSPMMESASSSLSRSPLFCVDNMTYRAGIGIGNKGNVACWCNPNQNFRSCVAFIVQVGSSFKAAPLEAILVIFSLFFWGGGGTSISAFPWATM